MTDTTTNPAANPATLLDDPNDDAPADELVGTPTPPPPNDTEPENAEDGGSESDEDGVDRLAVIASLAFWALLVLSFALINDGVRATLGDHPGWVVVGVSLLLVAAAVLGLRWYVDKRGPLARAGMVLGFGLPIFGALIATVLALPQDWQLIVLRSSFLLIVIFTPSVMWLLFVSVQRESLLNEYLANLDRLGLLKPGDHVLSEDTRQIRVSAYLQKFEATYVPIARKFRRRVVEGDLRPSEREEMSGVAAPLASTAVPVLLTLALLAIGWLLTLPPADIGDSSTFPRWLDALVPHPTPVTMAFLGAYFFTLQMIFRRYVRNDLRGSAYVAVVMRVILAVVGTWAVTEILEAYDHGLDQAQLLTVGFVIGVFPKVVWQIVQSIFARMFQIVLPSLEAKIPLSELDGLTVWHEARLEEEDIENVPNMATADLVDLLVRTRFARGQLIEWVDQAILLTELGPDDGRAGNKKRKTARDRLATYGIRNASTLLEAAKDAEARGCTDQFNQLLVDDGGSTRIPTLLVATRTHNNTRLVARWRGLSHLDDPAAAGA